jgi:pimeloyl-ACP methyl ester carboxylesterase
VRSSFHGLARPRIRARTTSTSSSKATARRRCSFLHGWPDTYRLWDSTVAALRDRYRCVRLSLPGFELAKPPRTPALADVLALIDAALARTSPDRPVTLVLHDWAACSGMNTRCAIRSASRASSASTSATTNTPAFLRTLRPRVKLGIVAYQLWLSVAWLVGGALGDRMARWMAVSRGCPTDPARIGAQMCWPYAMRWFGVRGGMRGLATVAPKCPFLYVYSAKRAGMFHSREFIATLETSPGSAAVEFPTGHWVMLDDPAGFDRCVAEWLTSSS